MKNVKNISLLEFCYYHLICFRLIVVLLGFSCLTIAYADSQSVQIAQDLLESPDFGQPFVQSETGNIYIQNNRLYSSNDTAKKPLTGSRLVGALYNASFDGRYVLYGGAEIVEDSLLPDPTLFVLDVRTGAIANINNLFSMKVIVGGSFAPNAYNLAFVNIDDSTLHIVDFEFGNINKSVLLPNARYLSFQPVWNAAGDQVAIYLTDCLDCGAFNQSDERNTSGWLILNAELPDKDNNGNLQLVQKLSEAPDFGLPFVQLESEEAGVIATTCVDSPAEVGGDITLRLPYRNGEQYPVSQGYCSDGGSHRGFEVDFSTPSGTVVVATAPGIVIEGGADNSLHYDYPCTGISGNDQNGTNVRLLHQGKTKQWISYYLHLTYPRLTKAATIGAVFQAGEMVGFSGNTGCTTGPHLHFQMRNAINIGGTDGVRPTPMQGVELGTGQSPITYFYQGRTYLAKEGGGGGNLTPYQPSGWSDKIVVSKTTGTNIDSSPLYTTDTLYIDWAVINNGTGAIADTFFTKVYVDGVVRQSWNTPPPLNVNYYAYVTDYSIGSLSAGTHSIKVVTDVTGAVQEGNESDNEYTKAITVQPPPDTISPTIVITSPTSESTYTTTNGSLNLGGTASDNVGVTQVTWSNSRGGSGAATGTTSWSVGGITLQSGVNVITVTARDAANNTGTDTITVTYSGGSVNLTPYKPKGWSDKIVVSNRKKKHKDSSPLYTTDTLYIDWAVLNNGTGATTDGFWTTLYVDGVKRKEWYVSPPLNSYWYWYESDFSIGTLGAGTHSIKIVADTTGVVRESNETDNEYTKTINIINR